MTAVESTMTTQRYPGSAILVALFVALTGPLIGVLTLLAFVLARTIARMNYEDIAMPNAGDLAQVVLFFSMFAYVFAGFAALVAGVLLGWRTYTHGTFGYLFAMAIAALATFVGTASLDMMVGQPERSFFGMAIFFTPFSLVAAAIGRWLMVAIGILPTIRPT
ncbi:MAG: hypothetical protein IKE66_11900 [Hyphomicrobium sp.]|nr:hypothetical protein [Hyphomicrobium sp.]